MIRSPRVARLALGFSATFTLALIAPAQAQTRDAASGESLFRLAREAIERGSWAEGCPKFEASMALLPSASTLLNIAKCHEHDGKLASAWADAKRALVLNRETPGEERRRDLEALASSMVASLEPKLPKLRIQCPSLEGLSVMRDDATVLAGTCGEALPVDPGPHVVRATAPRHLAFNATITAEEGKTASLDVVLAEAPPEAIGASGVDPKAPASPPGEPKSAGGGGGISSLAWVAGAAGLGLGVGAVVFAIDGSNASSTIDANCPQKTASGAPMCDATRFDPAPYNARKNRDVPLAIVFGAASALGVGTAIVLIATASPKTRAQAWHVTPYLTGREQGLTFDARF